MPISEDYVNSIKEAEKLYALGCFKGCISICGILAESYCKDLASIYNIKKDIKQQYRIDKLFRKKAITEEIKNELHIIRLNRNDCIHNNSTTPNSQNKTMQSMALV